MSTASEPMYQWHTIRWPKIERKVFKLQKRIYRAAPRGDDRRVRRLQKLLLRSHYAKLLAVRQVTQDNRGKKTPGVDGITALTPAERRSLAEHLQLNGNAAPVIRYADDLVVIHPDRAVIEQSQALMAEQLRGMGLELKPSKTRITHTLNAEVGGAGFDFLGFNIRQYPTKAKRGYKTIITPSREAVAQHKRQIAAVVRQYRPHRQERLIEALDPVIRGWSHYFSTVCSSKTFEEVDAELRHQLRSWSRFRHPNKPRQWACQQYWRQAGGRVHFMPQGGGTRLTFHTERPIRRHVKVQARRSPYDGDEVYWSTRQGHYPGVSKRVSTLLKRQAGKCRHCGYYFKIGDVLEVDHIIPRAAGGRDAYTNWQLLHRYCHVEKTARERRRCA
jgi:RNA-directed DNA polymerase